MSRDIIRTSVIRRTLVASAATVATALILTPTSAFAAGGGPGGGGKPSPPKPAGPVQTTTRIVMPKLLVSGKALTVSAHVSPAHRGGFGTPAESGTVIITVDGTAGSPLKLAANKASEKVKFTAGKHTVSAKYSGDAAHVASNSGEVSVTVN
jgi:Bacterial Ig-like domain (group 3)